MHARRLSYALSALLLCGVSALQPASAITPHALAKQAEASMVVLGSITVAPDGSVASYQLDQATELPAAVTGLLQQSIPVWQFEPVKRDGKAVYVKSRMSLRVVLHSLDDKRYKLYLAGAYFSPDGKPSFKDTGPKRIQPYYPGQAVRARVSGTVYLVLKIDPQGHVIDALAEQVNLRVAGDEHQMERFRGLLANSALDAARKWVFDPQLLGGGSGDHYAAMPVNYWLSTTQGATSRPDAPGHWDVYIPGPRQALPWFDAGRVFAGSVDALPDSGVYVLDPGGLQLKTKLGGA